ncbi:hypothetical protein CgunFtcFv8_009679 [Champsocephalus gunnari]|uniref:Uncharacterized protein n=1 Tax=Champsocephalus gunnari TaxID=52237 RepID=A0AAN8C2R9_CHAGU|nr:hypothetical protein CgunFtcFv8_009679 [Champsocephalus gunnari]
MHTTPRQPLPPDNLSFLSDQCLCLPGLCPGHQAARSLCGQARGDISGHRVSDVSPQLPGGAVEARDRARPKAAGSEKGHCSAWCD